MTMGLYGVAVALVVSVAIVVYSSAVVQIYRLIINCNKNLPYLDFFVCEIL